MKKQSKKVSIDVGPRRWTIPETGSGHTTKQTLPNINRSIKPTVEKEPNHTVPLFMIR